MLKGRILKVNIGVAITLTEMHISSCVTAKRLFEDALAKLRLLDTEFLFTNIVPRKPTNLYIEKMDCL
ncbi:hypothetical protein T11_2292 [Trichinella zimbabwensis]|uniref:Uncharacterized protein n=1 Tax=Trichinella zimbabwensis TaxID=268475 RepID=A0A0V1GV29_9BILA|nr:hypothetical protein T11_2292 [Trichinella zimbabwensis]